MSSKRQDSTGNMKGCKFVCKRTARSRNKLIGQYSVLVEISKRNKEKAEGDSG